MTASIKAAADANEEFAMADLTASEVDATAGGAKGFYAPLIKCWWPFPVPVCL